MILQDKLILVTGIASNRSIAYGIAQSLHEHGANLILTYQNDKLKPRVEKAAQHFQCNHLLECDLASDQSLESLSQYLNQHQLQLDGIVHAAAYAPGDLLEGSFVEKTHREGFLLAHDISSYSLTALTQACYANLSDHASIITLSYIGAIRAIPNYNTMGVAKASLEASVRYMAADLGSRGIRVNAISAGPIRTLAASGIKDFKSMLDENAKRTPLKRNTNIEEVGSTATFLASSMASGITGSVLYVDSGYHIT